MPEPFRWNHRVVGPLDLNATLRSGQAFRWRRSEAGVWWGAIGENAVALYQPLDTADAPLSWQTFPENDRWDLIADYLRLEVDLEALYADWIASEPRIAEATERFRGLRILRQPPVECFVSFQCATCNTVLKIERSVRKLAERYGEPIPMPRSLPFPQTERRESRPFLIEAPPTVYAFPPLEALAKADEAVLRADLWGYRAPRVIALARTLLARQTGWLESLRESPYAEAKAALVSLHGIGAKIADCIGLFCLDKDDAVPVDTHVRQIACRLFLPEMENKSLTPRVYEAIADAYRERFGLYAGWAQQYLFFAELARTQPQRSGSHRQA